VVLAGRELHQVFLVLQLTTLEAVVVVVILLERQVLAVAQAPMGTTMELLAQPIQAVVAVVCVYFQALRQLAVQAVLASSSFLTSCLEVRSLNSYLPQHG
jgi:hypothetical protein